MRTIALQCNHCGAPLRVAESARFVTCTHCDSQLAIRHEGDAAWTELSERVDRNHEELSRNLEVVQIQNELQNLERDWDRTCDRHRIQPKNGKSRLPDDPGAPSLVVGVVVSLMVAIFGLAISLTPFVVFGVVMGFITFFGGRQQATVRKKFQQLRREYDRERRDLLSRLRDAKGGDDSGTE